MSASSIGHTILDWCGWIPVIGDACDAVNALWYLAEGDYENAALSAVAMIPMLGTAAAKGAKWGSKAFKASKLGKNIAKYGGKALDFGKTLGKNIAKGVSDN